MILGEDRSRALNLALMVGFYPLVAGLAVARVLPWPSLLALLGLTRLLTGDVETVWGVYRKPKPTGPPEGYPVWPLWYTAAAFVHTRRAGALFVVGLAVAAIWPSLA